MNQLLKDYMIKTYYKTGSLISNSLRGVAMISGQNLEVQTLFFRFGQHIGIAFQLIDDILDYLLIKITLFILIRGCGMQILCKSHQN